MVLFVFSELSTTKNYIFFTVRLMNVTIMLATLYIYIYNS